MVVVLFIATITMPLIRYQQPRSYFMADVSKETKGTELAIVRTNLKVSGIDTEHPSYYNNRDLDIAVIGFPKTGTTFLLRVLGRHKEIFMQDKEFCGIEEHNGDEKLRHYLQNKIIEAKAVGPSHRLRYGIKCPVMVRNMDAIENLAKVSTNYTRLVVGVRHPALWFQSFYNFR